MRLVLAVVAVTSGGCVEGCEGGASVAVYHLDGSGLERTPDEPGEDLPYYQLRVCDGVPETVVATMITGCGGTCVQASAVIAIDVDSPTVDVELGPPIESDLEEVRLGHPLIVTTAPGAIATVSIDLEAAGPNGGYRAADEFLVVSEACDP